MPNHDRFECQTAIDSDAILHIHEMLANIGYFLIAMHAAAALFHHYIQKDDTFSRMLPGKS